MDSTEADGLSQLAAEGVSPWLDGVSQEVIASGRLASLVKDSTLRGATSNVDVLNAAVARDWHYRDRLTTLVKRDMSVERAAQSLSTYDARQACTQLRPVFETTHGRDGHVSVDLDPALAGDAESTVREATRLTGMVNRSNLLVKIQADDRGIHAIRDCLGAGIGVHASDIFSVRRYREVLDAYFDGLELALSTGLRPAAVGMVTAVPVGRIDAAFDARLDTIGSASARTLRGQGSLAIARLTYRMYEHRLGTDRWRDLRAAGAHPPRLMWTDTAVSSPAQPATRYVDEFVAWGTANAMSLSTLDAVVKSARLRGDTLTGRQESAAAALHEFERLGISSTAVSDRLEVMSARRQTRAWQRLRAQVASQLRSVGWEPR